MFPNQPGLDQMRDQQERMRQQQQDLRNRQMAAHWQETHGAGPPPLPFTGYRPPAISRFIRWLVRLVLWLAGAGLLVYAGFAAFGAEWSLAAGGAAAAVVLFLLRRPLRWR